jgi:methylmalonyl-CoA/ethylmalonyl-CoA epimerase
VVAATVSNLGGPLQVGNGALHHLGFVVRSIAGAAADFQLFLSASWDGRITHDPIQKVGVAFFNPIDPRNPVFELVEPASECSPVTGFLSKGAALHHVCYEVDDLDSVLGEAQRVGFALVAAATPAVAFEGRRIAWVCSRNRLLLEFLER